MTAIRIIALLVLTGSAALASASHNNQSIPPGDSTIGSFTISTLPFDRALQLISATYTPSGKVLVAYAKNNGKAPGSINLGVMDDDGENFLPFFSKKLPLRTKVSGIRYMVFADNRRWHCCPCPPSRSLARTTLCQQISQWLPC